MMTDRFQPSPGPGDIGGHPWAAQQRGRPFNKETEPRLILNVQGHSFQRHSDRNAPPQRGGYGTLKGNSSSAINNELNGVVKTLDHNSNVVFSNGQYNSNNQSDHLESTKGQRFARLEHATDYSASTLPIIVTTPLTRRGNNGSTLSRRNHHSTNDSDTYLDGYSTAEERLNDTDAGRSAGKMPNGKLYSPSDDESSFVNRSSRKLSPNTNPASRRYEEYFPAVVSEYHYPSGNYSENRGTSHEPRTFYSNSDGDYQSDSTNWSTRNGRNLRTGDYLNARAPIKGDRIYLDGFEVDYNIPRSSPLEPINGIKSESSNEEKWSRQKASLINRKPTVLEPINTTGKATKKQTDNRANRQTPISHNPGSSQGSSILKKSDYTDASDTLSTHRPGSYSGSMARGKKSTTKPNKGSSSRRVLFKNNVAVYRFDSEDSACSSSECERLNTEPRHQRRPFAHRNPATLQRATDGRSYSYDDLTGTHFAPHEPFTSSLRRVRHSEAETKTPSRYDDNVTLTKRTHSVGDLRSPWGGSMSYYNPYTESLGLRRDHKGQVHSSSGQSTSLVRQISDVTSSTSPETSSLDESQSTTFLGRYTPVPRPRTTGVKLLNGEENLNGQLIIKSLPVFGRQSGGAQTDRGRDTQTDRGRDTVTDTLPRKPSPAQPHIPLSSMPLVQSSMPTVQSSMTTVQSSMTTSQASMTPIQPSISLVQSSRQQDTTGQSSTSIVESSTRTDSSKTHQAKNDTQTRNGETTVGRSVNVGSQSSTLPSKEVHNSTAKIGNHTPRFTVDNNGLKDQLMSERSFVSERSFLSERSPTSHKIVQTKHVDSPSVSGSMKARHVLTTDAETKARRIQTTLELSDLKLTPNDIRVKSNKAGTIIHIIAAAVMSDEQNVVHKASLDKRLALPVRVDPYRITARLDDTGRLIIEAPVVDDT